MTKIRIGQIGTGHAHAAGWMGAYRKSDDYEVVGICEPDGRLLAQAKLALVYKDLKWMNRDELLAVKGLQAVAVETEPRHSLDHAEACVAAGLHVQLDKPPGASLPHFKKVLDIAASKHLLVQLGYMYRHNPAVLLLRDMLKQGWLGEPFEVHAVMSKTVEPATRRTLAKQPGGMMYELGCHLLDLAVGVLGQPSKAASFAQHVAKADDALADNMLAVLTYARAIASVKSSALEFDGFARRHFVVCGSQGTFHIQPLDTPSAFITLSKQRGTYAAGYQEVKFGNYARYVGDAAQMARVIRGEREADYSYDHDLAVQKTLLLACGLPTDK